MRFLILGVPIIAFLFVGCMGHVTVRVSPSYPEPVQTRLAEVKVNDLRQPGVAASKREAAFGVPMGNITFDPPEVQLVKDSLESELTKILKERGIQEKQQFICDIVEFGVNTNTTPL